MSFVVVGAGPTGVEMAGQIAELSKRTLTSDFRHIDPADGPDHPRRRRATGAARVRRPARRDRAATPGEDGRGRPARRQGRRRRRHRHRGAGRERPVRLRAPDRGRREGLGRRRAGQPARPVGRHAGRRRDRPRRTCQGRPRPHPARPPRGVRPRRHDRARQPARRGPGGHPGRQVRGQAGQAPAGRAAHRARVPLLRQGLDGDGLAVLRGGQRRPAPVRRVRRVDALAGDPPLLPDRVQVPDHHAAALVHLVPRPRPVRAGHHRAAGLRARGDRAARRRAPAPPARSAPRLPSRFQTAVVAGFGPSRRAKPATTCVWKSAIERGRRGRVSSPRG